MPALPPIASPRRRYRYLPIAAALLSLATVPTLIAATRAPTETPPLGATYDAGRTRLTFRVFSAHATRIEVWLYSAATGQEERARLPLQRDPATNTWSVALPTTELRERYGITGTVYYGYRAWGPNWPYDPAWTKGSSAGFVADVDTQGDRFDPNKLLLDPYAREISHDPVTSTMTDGSVYQSGEKRTIDTGAVAPKGIVLPPDTTAVDVGPRPARAFKDEILYEVSLRGLTRGDTSLPPVLRGTYAGAARKAAYLKRLGITAVEFLPVQETANDQNDDCSARHTTNGMNYWGYGPNSYFAPDRRYAADRSPGGPTREWRQMVRAFHAQGIKVYIDVVYNHTGEGGAWGADGRNAQLLSWRGLDAPTYYELAPDRRFYWDNTGCGANENTANPAVRQEIVDSLRYWHRDLGVDGFRFDLAPILGNAAESAGFTYRRDEPNNALNRLVQELPARPATGGAGVDLIAEPWGIGDGTYQIGNFPAGWADWNDHFRDTIRRSQNKVGIDDVSPGALATRIAGSSDLFQANGRKPWSSVNFIVCHDGFTLRDLYSYNTKRNKQPWPFGPSDGGTDDNHSWDQGGDPARQRQAVRTGMALLLLAAGVPMFTGGDEMFRTQYGNNNAYNLDSEKNWLDWSDLARFPHLVAFTRNLTAFRRAHPALRPADFFTGTDHNGNGRKDITWLRADGREPDDAYFNDSHNRFLGYRLDGTEYGDPAASLYVAYNADPAPVTVTLPSLLPGKRWYQVLDTAARQEATDNSAAPGHETPIAAPTYGVGGRSLALFIER